MEDIAFIFVLVMVIAAIIAIPFTIIWAFDHNDWDKEDVITKIPGSNCKIIETYESNQWNGNHRNTHREVFCPQ